MKLFIDVTHDPDTQRDRVIITDDRGHRLRCVRAVSIDSKYNDASRVTVELVVNGRDVVLGRPLSENEVPPFVDEAAT